MASSASSEARSEKEKEEVFSYAIQLVDSVVLPMTLHTIIELGVFDILSKAGPDAKLSASEIVAQMPTKNKDAPQMLDRMLRLLASHSVVGCSVVDFMRLYSLNPVSECFVDDQNGVSLGPVMALTQDKVFLDSWSQLRDAVLEGGIPFNRVHGMHAFEYPGLDPRFNQVFNKAMNNTTKVWNMLGEICSKAIFMKWILHDWSDEHCLKLLKNCYKSIPENGKLIVVESVLPDFPETNTATKAAFQVDVLMMTQNPGGKERSRQEYMALATGAGFSGIRFETSACNSWVMEFYK
ncbi:hypothetical protein LWI28_013402 [Acer negundo]|uniref:Uncharacterized protein n=1 Tax=Acer negundo TaxID=4023 RepID=A0AAD5IZJ4_ACENE|nr:hypothetical protein LWI28_013402 [Acer negundo]